MASPRPAGSWVCSQPPVRRHGRARRLTPPLSGHPQAHLAHLRLPLMLNVMHYSHIAAGRVGSSVRAVARWARSQPDVRAAAVVGSWARGTARLRSDIDFMFLSTRPKARCASAQWAARLASRALGSCCVLVQSVVMVWLGRCTSASALVENWNSASHLARGRHCTRSTHVLDVSSVKAW
jgi:predicted nucleotidyltransferase